MRAVKVGLALERSTGAKSRPTHDDLDNRMIPLKLIMVSSNRLWIDNAVTAGEATSFNEIVCTYGSTKSKLEAAEPFGATPIPIQISF